MSRQVATTRRRRAPARGAASSPTQGLARLAAGTPVRLYHRIKEDLTLQIRSGSWRPAQEIPSEVALCRHYRVSRGTIRRAIADLVQQGLVFCRQGRGSFVSQPKLEGSVLGSYRQYMKGHRYRIDLR
jgi:DNA-binding GntR family transcriptional regulator